MTDIGTVEERAAALRVAEACMALNNAISDTNYIGVNVKVIDTVDSWDDPSSLQVARMERRTMILPTACRRAALTSHKGDTP